MNRNISLEEWVALLERSMLPTIIIEGSDDVLVYREFEKKLNVDVLPVGGRNTILEIFKEKNTNPKLANKNIIFIADLDTWVYQGLPDEYNSSTLIFTNGYSIENDILRDYGCENILINTPDIYQKYKEDVSKFIQWYALALQSMIQNINQDNKYRKLSTHPQNILNDFDNFKRLLEGECSPESLINELTGDYLRLIRGKSLLAIFTKNLNHHKEKAIFESIAIRPGKYIQRIFDDVSINFCHIN
ncbi:hypothetical protein ACTHR3_10810 [Neisseria sp. P0005.S008]|jgi:hypothetical protein|uniref:hypothetical protein n=1 Tax=Neisseria sp. P0005.S008 TaxID=3436682 RepID=UPI0035FBE258